MNTTLPIRKLAAPAPVSLFERYLTVWVLLCIVAGIALGQLMPGVFQAVGRIVYAKVNLQRFKAALAALSDAAGQGRHCLGVTHPG